ncbi:MAG: hypothetical protein R3336_07875, partial [Phycisphaeraceae bacterium]|nr:hypothetical protein [Phycisphaeraceae bacterium]
MRIAVDAMGGDNAPDAIIAGCLDSVELLGEEDELVLVGDQQIIADALAADPRGDDPRLKIEAAGDVIEMHESPVQAVREKPDSSMVVAANLGSRKAGEKLCDVVISAGNTGACVAAAQMAMRRLPGVHRPGIGVTLPTFHGPVVICDV